MQFQKDMGNRIEITKETETIDILSRIEEFLNKILKSLNQDFDLTEIIAEKVKQKKLQQKENIKKNNEKI